MATGAVLATQPAATPASSGSASTPTPASTPKPAASAGLLNDWLRGEADAFKPWDLGGEFRVRYETKANAGDGSSASVDFMKSPPAGKFNDNDYLLLREKIHVGYSPADWFTVYGSVRDAYSDGDRREPPKTSDRIDLEQAWAKLGGTKSIPFSIKVGRQEMVYGDERMVGRADWNNLGSRIFEAAVARYEASGQWIDAFVGRPILADDHNWNEPNDYDWLSGCYASSKKLLPFQESQAYVLVHTVAGQSTVQDPGVITRASTPQDTATVGLRFKSLPAKLGAWDYTFEFAGQFGDVKVGKARLDQEAFAIVGTGGYTWKETWGSPRLSVGYELWSGDDDPKDDRNGTFEPLFPTNHRPLGLMDLVGAKNIHDPRVGLNFKPVKPLAVWLEWHWFWLAEAADSFYNDGGTARSGNGYGRNPQYGNFAGSEVDLDVIYTFKPWLVARAGYGHFFVGDYVSDLLAATGGAQDADWFYAQVGFSF